MTLPLANLLVVSLEQAVAAPYCSSRLADAGARVIKIERPEGDFARGYDTAANGLSSYFVWLNRGKQSLVADIKRPDDAALLHRILGRADVFIQNLAPVGRRGLQPNHFVQLDLPDPGGVCPFDFRWLRAALTD